MRLVWSGELTMKHLVFDCETTGLAKNSIMAVDKQPRIIEITAATWNDETDTVYTIGAMFNPGIPIPPAVTKITGITDAMVKDGRIFHGEDALAFRDLIESADVVVAHNLSFDKLIIDSEFERANERKPKWPRGVCTVEATEHLNGFRMKLDQLHYMLFGTYIEGAHRSKADVEALLRCYQELLKQGEI